MATLIPAFGGKNPVNGLKIQKQTIVVFDVHTLEILSVHGTYTSSDEHMASLWRESRRDARDTRLNWYSESISATDLVGMTLNRFQSFVEENSHHPLLASALE